MGWIRGDIHHMSNKREKNNRLITLSTAVLVARFFAVAMDKTFASKLLLTRQRTGIFTVRTYSRQINFWARLLWEKHHVIQNGLYLASDLTLLVHNKTIKQTELGSNYFVFFMEEKENRLALKPVTAKSPAITPCSSMAFILLSARGYKINEPLPGVLVR